MGAQRRAELGKGWDNPAILSHKKLREALKQKEAHARDKSRRVSNCCVSGCSKKCSKRGKGLLCGEHERAVVCTTSVCWLR